MKKITLLLVLFLGYSTGIWAYPVEQYRAFIEKSGTYQPISYGGGTLLWDGQDADDEEYYQPFGFNFTYAANNNDVFTGVTISSNGVVRLGNSGNISYINALNSTSEYSNNIIAPLWDDLIIRAADNGRVWTRTDGTTPNRVFIVDWQNISWRNTGQTVSFQLRIYETSNNIEFIYGPNNSTEARTASIGINHVNADGTFDFMSVTPGTPATMSTTTANNSLSSSDYPGNGTVYQFKHGTYMPDDNFEAALYYIDDVPDDNYVKTKELRAFTTLNVSNQDIVDLTGIEDAINLTSFTCLHNDNLSTINLNQNVLLTEIDFQYCHVSSLDISSCILLENINGRSNYLGSTFDPSPFPNLTYLNLDQNYLEYIDLSNNPLLETARFRNNELYDIVLDNNPNLQDVDVSFNVLESMSIQNGNNSAIADVYFIANDNPDLTCIYVDDFTWSTNNWSHIDATTHFVETAEQCAAYEETYVPDANFENYLETHTATGTTVPVGDANSMGNGVANDHYVTKTKIIHVTDLSMMSKSISDLTGIEDFWDLENLSVQNNNLTALDLSNNTSLLTLNASHNSISSLNLGTNSNLTDCNVSYNSLTFLSFNNTTGLVNINAANNSGLTDINISYNATLEELNVGHTALTGIFTENNPNLKTLYATFCQISSLDLSSNPLLELLHADSNNLTTLNLNANIALKDLGISDNAISSINLTPLTLLEIFRGNNNSFTTIDFSSNTKLTTVSCTGNQLPSLDLSNQEDIVGVYCSNNNISNLNISEGYNGQSDLLYLYCENNQISGLDLSGLEMLEELFCQDNQLEVLNVANGNNDNFGEFDATNNPSLSCVQVDSASYMNTNWASAIDATASYSENCHLDETYVPDDNFEHYLETHNNIGNPVSVGDPNSLGNGVDNDDYVTTSKIETLTGLYIYNQSISDLTGIEDFAALQTLSVFNNQLTSLNFSNNANLQYLYCQDNQLANLDVSNNSALQSLYCYSNQLTSLDVSQNANLKKLWVHNNQLTGLNLDSNPLLEQLWCQDNQLTELHIQNGANNLLSGTFTQSGNTYARMRATGNPALTCIYVDDAAAANNGTGDYQDWEIDATTTYVSNTGECQALSYEDYNQIENLNLIPNPAIDTFSILTDALVQKVRIFDYTGRKVGEFAPQQNYDISTLHSGVYFVVATTEKGSGTKRLIVK